MYIVAFSEQFVPLPFPLCMESFSFPVILLYLVTTDWIFHISCIFWDNSIQNSNVNICFAEFIINLSRQGTCYSYRSIRGQIRHKSAGNLEEGDRRTRAKGHCRNSEPEKLFKVQFI